MPKSRGEELVDLQLLLNCISHFSQSVSSGLKPLSKPRELPVLALSFGNQRQCREKEMGVGKVSKKKSPSKKLNLLQNFLIQRETKSLELPPLGYYKKKEPSAPQAIWVAKMSL